MPIKQRITQYSFLHQKKYRIKFRLFLAEGIKIVSDILSEGYPVEEILATQEWIDQNDAILKEKKMQVTQLSITGLRKISNLETPQEVIAVCRFPEFIPTEIRDDGWYLFLDSIRDPGNLGTLIRIADWFGVEGIFLSEDTVDWTNPKVIQGSMGSFMRLNLETVNSEYFFRNLPKSVPVYAADLEGDSIYKAKIKQSGILIISNESRGLNAQLKQFITGKICIPRFSAKEKAAESLNAGVACGIILGEIMKRKLEKK